MYNINLTESYFPAQSNTPLEPITIGDMLRKSAATWPEATALREVLLDGSIGRCWTYQELLEDSQKLGKVLAGRHSKGARVAVWAPNIPEWILLEFGLAFAGVTLVTVNPALQARELEYVLSQSRAEAIYYVESFRGNPMADIVEKVCNGLPAIQHRIVMDDLDALYRGEECALPDVFPEDAAQIQYTSGTTGFPKGAVLHHHGLVQNGKDTMERLGLLPGMKSLNYMPLFHTTGCAVHTLGMMSHGGNMGLMAMFDPVLAAEVIEREQLSMIVGVPTMLVALIEEASRKKRDFSSVKAVTSGGAMVSPELARSTQQWFGKMVQIIYGQTESSPVITMVWGDDVIEDVTETIGQPLPHVEVSIRDPHTNHVVDINQQGEICARGYLVMKEYNDNPDATKAAIDEERWLHTGDLGRMDARGYVKITGRVKEMIIRGGENLFPAEIENAMLEHDDIAEVAVVGMIELISQNTADYKL